MYVPVSEIVSGIFRMGPIETGRLERGRPSGPTSPYLVLGKDKGLIAEPGEGGQIPGLLEGLAECAVDVDKIAYVWSSHIHLHHIQGVPELLKKLPNAKFLVHPRGYPHVIEPNRLVEQSRMLFGDKCYGPFEPIPKDRAIPTEDGQIIDLGGKKLQILHTPGHAPHHHNLFDLETRALFSGDIAMLSLNQARAHYDVRPPLFDLDRFLQSVRRLRDLKPTVMLSFRHGGISHHPDRTLRWVEEDHLIIERICREGMKQGRSYKQIVQDVEDYTIWIGSRPEGSMAGGVETSPGMLYGMIAYVKKMNPDIPVPADASPKMRPDL